MAESVVIAASDAATLPTWPDQGADAMERALLDQWRAEALFDRVQTATASGAPWVFFEGPPTANGRPGIHHVFSRTIKDMVCRYHVMLGQRVTRKAGWDTHGLPVELEVEKQLGFTGKQDIEAFGVAEFNRRCLESVFTYRDEWLALSGRIGYWLDYDQAYITCSRDYIESVWRLLQQLHERELLYRGHRVLPYCPRCGTTLSSHELALGFEERRDKSVYVAVALDDGSGRELVVWTTTPWTLPSNIAIAVNPAIDYGTFRATSGRQFVAAVARASVMESLGASSEPDAVYSGRELVGLRYQRILDVVPMPEGTRHSEVVAGDFVTAEDGSGLVHLAPYGTDDYRTLTALGMAMPMAVATDGTFRGTTAPDLEGRLVTDPATNDAIIARLKGGAKHLRTEQHQHSYPHCWRCHSPLIYYPRDSWFVRTTAVKDRMLALNRAIGWHPPETGSGRFGEWLANNVDWALSRERYWGTPLPVWINDRDPTDIVVIGSFDELRQRAGWEPTDDLSVHKPWIDEVTWPAADGGTMRRAPEVIDTWFDSGAMPYAQWHFPFEHDRDFASHFPADFICEAVDQTRGWFYSLLAIGAAVSDTAPYRDVIVNAHLLDAAGQKMSKSRGNVIDPWAVVAEHGADAVRLYLVLASQVWQPRRFDVAQLRETAGRFLRTLRNTYQFLALYGGVAARDEPAVNATAPRSGADALIDQWILGRLDATVLAVRAALDGYDVTAAVRAVTEFVDADLSNWYVRLTRDRFWAPDGEADSAAVAVLRESLVTAARLLAPVMPFASDWMHRALTGTSVHLAPFPAVARDDRGPIEGGARGGLGASSAGGGSRFDPSRDRAMDAIRRLASLGRAARETAGLRVRQPLARLKIAVPPDVAGPTFDALLALLRSETNVRSVEVVTSDAELIRLRGKPNFRSLGKRFGAQVQAAAACVTALDPKALRQLEAGEAVVTLDATGQAIALHPDDVVLARDVVVDWPVASDGPLVVALDPELTPELIREGLARELVNRIQRLRKDLGYEVTARIEVALDGDAAVLEAARAHRDYVAHETLARRFDLAQSLDPCDRLEPIVIDDYRAVLSVRPVRDGRTLSDPTPVATT